MEAERPHLDRAKGDVEQGIADVIAEHPARHAAPHSPPPAWLVNWENSRPVWLTECFAEMMGVFFYTYAGIAASASFYISSAEGINGYGSLLSIAVAYGLGIVFALVIAAPCSGGHLSPGYTISFWLLKGFPGRKVPRYILSQILGAFIACLFLYGQYKQQLDAIHLGLVLKGEDSVVFSPQGPAGLFGLFATPGQGLGYVFLNEFMACTILSILVFAVLDPSNFFVSFTAAPWLIGMAYAALIIGVALDSLALNTARDLGGRLACAAIYGRQCFNAQPGYVALAALTNIPATFLGAMIHTILLSDTARLVVNLPPADAAAVKSAFGENGAPLSIRALTRDGGEKS